MNDLHEKRLQIGFDGGSGSDPTNPRTHPLAEPPARA
jgi:hypothetical protein